MKNCELNIIYNVAQNKNLTAKYPSRRRERKSAIVMVCVESSYKKQKIKIKTETSICAHLQTCETCLAIEFRSDFHLDPLFDADILLLEIFDPSAMQRG